MSSSKEKNAERARSIEWHLRVATLPVGVKFWKEGEDIPPAAAAGIDPAAPYTYCQFVNLARFERTRVRKTFLVREQDIACPVAPGVLGFRDWGDDMYTGYHFGGVHFATAEQAKAANEMVPRVPVNTVQALTVGPLEDLEMEPDVIVLAITPGQSDKFSDGALWHNESHLEVVFANMCGVCGAATAKAYIDPEHCNIAFPCHGARRMGIWMDNELVASVPVKQFESFILGMEKSFASGHSYPIGHVLCPNPPMPPHFKIWRWPDDIRPLDLF